ncbi:MAG: histidinol dehydrogenase [Actinobacteria bacterium]|nr:MAG: histidinol dehydrogenase [Actinomycetota bacterium]
MRILRGEDFESPSSLREALGWDFWTEEGPVDEVRAIIARVRDEGDAALIDLTRRYDGVDLTSRGLRVGAGELARSAELVGHEFSTALKAAVKSITSFHRHQTWESQFWESEEGARIGQMAKPLHRVGAYVPGGKGAYPSTAIMTLIPAKVAGVPEIAVCVPPAADGEISPYTLFALHTLGVEEIYRVGGAQAVAAMALGTQAIRAVDKVVGPGNVYVTLAKKEVMGRVGIDMLAGPSELVVLASAEADVECIVLEMMAQMEHGSGARACLVATDESLIRQVEERLSRAQTGGGDPRQMQASAALVADLDEGADLVNELAPEHLVIATDDVTGILPKVHNAGAIFLGADSPVALGDYAVGVNHVLPTKGAARYSSPLGVYDFVKMSNIVFSNPKANRALGPVIEAIAKVEGFINHADAMRRRCH